MADGRVLSAEPTAGGGFVFEDEVAACFLSCMLVGKPVFGESGGILTNLAFQQSNSGWVLGLDDMVLTSAFGERERRCGLSLKSNAQFTRNGAPPDFVQAVWTQVLAGPLPVERDTDWLGIVVSGLSAKVHSDITRICELAGAESPAQFQQNLESNPAWPSKTKRPLIDSFRCPTSMVEDARRAGLLVGSVLSRVKVLEMGFKGAAPSSLNEALANCRDALRSTDLVAARGLWESLLRIAQKRRPKEGTIDLSALVGELRARHPLSRYPYHEPDWSVVDSYSQGLADCIPDTLGSTLALPRQAETERLAKLVSDGTFVAVVGESGTGKTVLVKRFWESTHRNAVLVDAGDLDSGVWHQRVGTRLRYSIPELLGAAGHSDGLVIVDGLERLHSADGFRILAKLFKAADEASSAWTVLATCQAASWSEVIEGLRQANCNVGPWSVLQVGDLASDDLARTAQQFQQLGGILGQPRLRSILRKVKVLAILADRVSQGNGLPDTSSWAGEADVLEWYWNTVVRRGPDSAARSRVLQKMGIEQADQLRHELPGRFLDSGELGLASAMAREGICVEHDERIGFSHDLLGDWSRQRALLAEGRSLGTFLAARPQSPLWGQAVRLHGAHVVDRDGAAGWQELRSQLAGSGAVAGRHTDVLLDSLFLARECETVLNDLGEGFLADDGALLRTFLVRFLHFGTVPTAATTTVDTSSSVALSAIDSFRVPLWAYWAPVLRFLVTNLAQATRVAGVAVARIADLWLRTSRPGEPLRTEAASLALGVHRCFYSRSDGELVHIPDEAAQPVWRALLASIDEFPGEVSAVVREACGRGAEHIPDPDSLEDWVVPETWPGPRTRVDHTVQRLCLDTDALAPVMRKAPELAEELLLAFLVDEPPRVSWLGGSSVFGESELGLEHPFDWEPPFYTHGPFLRFLNENPEAACRTITRLVDFATDRWACHIGAHRQTSVTVEYPDGPLSYLGDHQTMFWLGGTCGGPTAAVSALMALEFWLLREAGLESPIDDTLDKLLKGSRSLAVVGVALSFGRHHPRLFQGILKPLLTVPEFYLWDSSFNLQHALTNSLGLAGWGLYTPRWLKEKAAKWHQRRLACPSLECVAARLLLEHGDMAGFFRNLRSRWEANFRGPDGGFPIDIENLLVCLDPANWNRFVDDRGAQSWRLEFPEDIKCRRQPVLEEMGLTQEWRQFPWHCRLELQGKPNRLPEAPEHLFGRARHFSTSQYPESLSFGGDTRADSVCGAIAVLFARHWSWLEQDPARVAWCTERLDAYLREPPIRPGPFAASRRLSAEGCEWEVMAADAAARLWMREPTMERNRLRVVRLVMHDDGAVIEAVFNSLAEQITDAVADFRRLQRIAFRWAFARGGLGNSGGATRTDLAAWKDAEVSAFVSCAAARLGERPTLVQVAEGFLADWSQTVSSPSGLRIEDLQPDHAVLLATCKWRTVREPVSPAHAEAGARFWRDMWEWTVRHIPRGVGRARIRQREPGDWERVVFVEVGKVCSRTSDEAVAVALIRSVLDLGPDLQPWLNFFFVGFLHEEMAAPSTPQRLIARWKALINEASTLPQWLPRTDSAVRGQSERILEFWKHALVFDWASLRSPACPHAPLLPQMLDEYRLFVERYLTTMPFPEEFVSFLAGDAASGLRMPLLACLAAVQSGSPQYRGSLAERCSQSLVAYLADVWTDHRQELLAGQGCLDAYLALLQPLVEHGNPYALELARGLEQARNFR